MRVPPDKVLYSFCGVWIIWVLYSVRFNLMGSVVSLLLPFLILWCMLVCCSCFVCSFFVYFLFLVEVLHGSCSCESRPWMHLIVTPVIEC